MVAGFNHNFRYQGEVYHIQTEDSGLKNPNIVTLLYQGGTILASKKTSYADIAKVDNLNKVVEELMKEQHKEMMKDLVNGRIHAARDLIEKEGMAPKAPPPDALPVEETVSSDAPTLNTDSAADRTLDELILDFLTTEPKPKKK